jgi:hypothetical protein
MTVTPKKLRPELQILGCIVALVLVTFGAIRLIGNSWDMRSHSDPETTAGIASAASTQKEHVRHQAPD